MFITVVYDCSLWLVRKRNSFGVNGGVDFVMVLYSEKVVKSGILVWECFWLKSYEILEWGFGEGIWEMVRNR